VLKAIVEKKWDGFLPAPQTISRVQTISPVPKILLISNFAQVKS